MANKDAEGGAMPPRDTEALANAYTEGLEAAAREADAVARREKEMADRCAARAEKNNYYGDALAAHDCRGAQRGAEEAALRIRSLRGKGERAVGALILILSRSTRGPY